MEPNERLEPYLGRLRGLPFVKGLTVDLERATPAGIIPDARIRLRTPKREFTFWAELKRTHLTRALVDGLLGQMAHLGPGHWILFAPHIGRDLGKHLVTHGANYIDTAGNCHIAIGDEFLVHVEGLGPARRPPLERTVRGPGYQVYFAILAQPRLLAEPVRVLARQAGVGKTAAAETLNRLRAEGIVGVDRGGKRLLDFQRLFDRWITGYATVVRPRLMIGRFQTNEPQPEIREERIGDALRKKTRWAWGGGAAAMRLTNHYHGPLTVLHLEHRMPDLGRRIGAVPAREGHLTVLGVPGPIALEGVTPNTVHPLLVHAELLATGDDRAREAAQEVRQRYLEPR